MAEKIYRCTRNAPYPPGSMGFYNLKERQGYYIPAHSAEEAIAKMQKFFPTDHQGFPAIRQERNTYCSLKEKE